MNHALDIQVIDRDWEIVIVAEEDVDGWGCEVYEMERVSIKNADKPITQKWLAYRSKEPFRNSKMALKDAQQWVCQRAKVFKDINESRISISA